MLTPQMTQTEVVGQVMQDAKWLQGRARMMGPGLRRDLRAQLATGRQTLREVLRQCDEAVEAERMLDERIRQKANDNDNEKD